MKVTAAPTKCQQAQISSDPGKIDHSYQYFVWGTVNIK
jgi:hypothetical protein